MAYANEVSILRQDGMQLWLMMIFWIEFMYLEVQIIVKVLLAMDFIAFILERKM